MKDLEKLTKEEEKIKSFWKSKELTKREKSICLYARSVMLTSIYALEQQHTSEEELKKNIRWAISHLEGEANIVFLSATQINNLLWLISRLSGEKIF